jgi:hypothetical protein
MKLMKKYCKILHILCQKPVDKKIQFALLQSPGLVKALSEIAHNLLRGNIALSKVQKKKLQRHKTLLRSLACKQYSCTHKRKIIQRGGAAFLPLLAPIISLLTSAFQ